MKKYHQLLLLMLSVVSVSLFLIYRHEYNRLHYVLEVFNFFGQPCNFSDLQRADSVLEEPDWGPQPSWQLTDGGSHVYSAFLTSQKEIRAIGLVPEGADSPRYCRVWFETRDRPVPGRFKYAKLAVDGNSTALLYVCTFHAEAPQVPYAVSFSYKEKRSARKVPLVNTLDHRLNANVTVCVSPTAFDKSKFVEFLSFHRLIGITSFVFYDRDVPYRLSKLVRNLSSRLDIRSTFLTWNSPKGDGVLTGPIVETDCLLRTFGRSKYVIALEMDEYIVPRLEDRFEAFLSHFTDEIPEIKFPVQKFCITSTTVNRPIALQNFEVVRNYTVVRSLKRNAKNDKNMVYSIDVGQGSVHKYVRCEGSPQGTVTDQSMLRFSTDFVRSTLVQLVIHNQL